ncbi:ABC transporter ATP-binding protein [Bacteroidota bacterium]
MNNVIEIGNLRKDFEGFRLNNVSFSVPEGYIMGLIGPNGAGKTTIIKLIMNLLRKNEGSIKIFGLDNIEFETEIKSRIGFVYDNPNYDHLNLKQIKGIIAPFYKTWDENVFRSLITKFNLPLNKKIKKFSRGMIMKSALAIALSHHADLIIMDEPTSGLDPLFRRELLDMFFELLQNEKKSILFSTHITSDLEKIADYITFINDGRLIFSSTKDEIFDNYSIIKGGNELLNEETNLLFKGIRTTQLGFEALSDNSSLIRKKLGKSVIVEKASLEDIMYFTNIK